MKTSAKVLVQSEERKACVQGIRGGQKGVQSLKASVGTLKDRMKMNSCKPGRD